jgi:hypothetical protein
MNLSWKQSVKILHCQNKCRDENIPFDHPMKDVSIVIALLGMLREILHRFGSELGKQFEKNVATGRSQNGGRAELLDGLCGKLLLAGWFLVEDIACGDGGGATS